MYGVDGQNGLRRELRNYQSETREQIKTLNAKIDKLVPKIIGAVSAIVAIIVGISKL
jgi:hypothetical protein